MALSERPDIPRTVFGVPGLNPINILLFGIMIGWFIRDKKKKAKFPEGTGKLLLLYAIIVFVSTLRQFFDMGGIIEYANLRGVYDISYTGMFNDLFINTYKYAVIGMLFFYGADSEERVRLGLLAIFIFNLLLAIQVIKWMPLSDIANGDVLEARARRVLDRQIGYYRTDLAAMLSGAAWAIYAYKQVIISKMKLLLVYFSALICTLGMALTGGRTGMASWAVVALLLSVLKWKHIIIILLLMSFSALIVLPSVTERLSQGFNADESADLDARSAEIEDRFQSFESETDTDLFTVTAGRVVIWPLIIDKIKKSPLLGYGRNAMVRTGISSFVYEYYGESFPHTHNAYLEMLLDNGIVMSLPIFVFFYFVVKFSIRLFKDSESATNSAVGGVALSLVAAQLVASFGAQSFYPTSGVVSMWAAIGILLRVYSDTKCGNESV